MGLRELESEYWDWRTVTAPDTSDDLPRLRRPPGWTPDWSPAAVEARRETTRSLLTRHEWARAVAAEAVLQTDATSELPAGAAEQVERQAAAEGAVRRHYVQKRLLSQPDSLRPYTFAPRPDYLTPLSWLGVTDNLVTGVRYIPAPGPGLGYFDRAAAEDPRLAIAHEGVHAQQMALSWEHPNPTRRRFYDSTPNEGIAFYNEELMLLSGLFDDNPRSRATIASFLRLRALRVEVDVALALGHMTIDEAAQRLATLVPVDTETAWHEAVFFAGNPGQAMSYLVGKHQILAMLAEASSRPGFDLMSFHDRLWLEGNVPLALQCLEIL